MYEPAPPRPKKTNICRSRNGCKMCRQRRKKCDDQKPCGLCMRLGVACEQTFPTLEFRSVFGPSRSRKTGVRPVTSLYQPNPPSCNFVAITGTSPKHWRRSPPRMGGGSDTVFDPDSLLNVNMIPQPELCLFYDPKIHNRVQEDYPCSDLFEEPLDLGSTESILVSLGPSLLPQQRTSDVVRFYLNIWDVHCLPALNLAFKSMETIRSQSSLITDTIATLAASRLSRKLPQRRLLKPSDSLELDFRPDSGHEALSSELYGSALRKMSSWSPETFDSNPMLAFATLVLFCYVESSMGHFKGFYIHSQGVEKLLKKSANLLFPHGAGLLAAWVEVKMQNWWRRAYFGVPEFFQDYFNPLLCPEMQFISNTTSGRTATILWILCESHRLNTAALIACWTKQGKNSPMLRENTASKLIDKATSASEQPIPFSELLVMIKIYSEKLDEWRAPLPGLAEIKGNPSRLKRLDLKSPENEAIYFSSHKFAMNMAYYVVARVMHSTGPLQTFDSASIHNIDDLYDEVEAWIFILLRIAAGISWEDCVCLNAYTIGFAGLLFTCALASRRLETGLWIQEWLKKRLDQGGIEEGNFPVFQILDAVRLINRERRNGLDVVALFQTVDDGGGRGKFGSYSSQSIWSMLVYARCRSTGELGSYHVSTGGLIAPK
ncbi:hypothetical protein GGI43DRAFT_419059 [Trichoderma evansii]